MGALAWTARAADPIPTPIGVTREYRLPALGAAVKAGRPVGDLACASKSPVRFRVHLELFARKLVLLVPAGIGVRRRTSVTAPT